MTGGTINAACPARVGRMIESMPIQQTPPPFWYRHPVLTGAGLLWGTWVLLDGWVATVTVICVLALMIAMRRRRRARVVRHAGLRARADLEHRFTLDGDPRGTYGRYPPAGGLQTSGL